MTTTTIDEFFATAGTTRTRFTRLFVTVTSVQSGFASSIDHWRENRPVEQAVVGFARGEVTYSRPRVVADGLRTRMTSASVRTTTFVPYLYSNRRTEGGQPFDMSSADGLSVEVYNPALPTLAPTAHLTVRSWGPPAFQVHLSQQGGVLLGTGPAAGNNAGIHDAVYIVGFEIDYQQQQRFWLTHETDQGDNIYANGQGFPSNQKIDLAWDMEYHPNDTQSNTTGSRAATTTTDGGFRIPIAVSYGLVRATVEVTIRDSGQKFDATLEL